MPLLHLNISPRRVVVVVVISFLFVCLVIISINQLKKLRTEMWSGHKLLIYRVNTAHINEFARASMISNDVNYSRNGIWEIVTCACAHTIRLRICATTEVVLWSLRFGQIITAPSLHMWVVRTTCKLITFKKKRKIQPKPTQFV